MFNSKTETLNLGIKFENFTKSILLSKLRYRKTIIDHLKPSYGTMIALFVC